MQTKKIINENKRLKYQHQTIYHKVGRKKKKKTKTNQAKTNTGWLRMIICPAITMTEFYSMETIDISTSNHMP